MDIKYSDLQKLIITVANIDIRPAMTKVSNEMGYSEGYLDEIITRYYRDPFAFIAGHNVGERLLEFIKEGVSKTS